MSLNAQRFVTQTNNGHVRLVWIRQKATSEFWERHWHFQDIGALVASAEADSQLLNVFRQYLQPGSEVLEAGCGLGQWVEVMTKNEFKCTGVDYGIIPLISASRHYSGNSRFVGADIRSLPFASRTFDAIISLGVIEHFWSQTSALIHEMVRTLRDGGWLFLSVPIINAMRWLKVISPWGIEEKDFSDEPRGFYQYAFSRQELSLLLSQCNIRIERSIHLSPVKGLKDEIPLMGRIEGILDLKGRDRRDSKVGAAVNSRLHQKLLHVNSFLVQNWLKKIVLRIINHQVITRRIGHMILMIGQKQ